MILPGVKYTADDLSQAQATAAAGDGSLLTDPPQCPYGSYCPGGTLGNNGTVGGTSSNSSAIACPYGTTTQDQGATSADACSEWHACARRTVLAGCLCCSPSAVAVRNAHGHPSSHC